MEALQVWWILKELCIPSNIVTLDTLWLTQDNSGKSLYITIFLYLCILDDEMALQWCVHKNQGIQFLRHFLVCRSNFSVKMMLDASHFLNTLNFFNRRDMKWKISLFFNSQIQFLFISNLSFYYKNIFFPFLHKMGIFSMLNGSCQKPKLYERDIDFLTCVRLIMLSFYFLKHLKQCWHSLRTLVGLGRMRVRLVFRRLLVGSSSMKKKKKISFVEIGHKNHFYNHSLLTTDSSRAVVSYWWKDVH